MGEQLDYQNMMDWIRQPEEDWPVKKTVTRFPVEARRKEMMIAIPREMPTAEATTVQAAETTQQWPPNPAHANTLAKLDSVGPLL
jgi:hypothetical protein